MFFQNCKPFKLLDMYRVVRDGKESNKKGVTEGRSWAAVAFRISGSSRFESGGKVYFAEEGSVLYIPSKVPFSRKGGAEELVILHIECYGDTSEIEVLKPNNVQSVKQAFLALYEEWTAKKEGFEYRCTAMLYTLLEELKRHSKSALPPYQFAMISPGVDMLNANFDSPALTVSHLAKACNISDEYFRKLYKAEYGISPHKAITDKRLDKAARLLRAGYFSIAKVSDECGFQNVKYFSALFHSKMKMSPREYKDSNS